MFKIVQTLLAALARSGAGRAAASKPGFLARVWKAAGLIWKALTTGADIYIVYDILTDVFGDEVASEVSDEDLSRMKRESETDNKPDAPVIVDLTHR